MFLVLLRELRTKPAEEQRMPFDNRPVGALSNGRLREFVAGLWEDLGCVETKRNKNWYEPGPQFFELSISAADWKRLRKESSPRGQTTVTVPGSMRQPDP